ncbi:MAG: RluA family pseudouridine synthase [Candidatus Binataceae bacterium]|jgi:23S rRNA pseudouridine1911/1915/1917 synthase
MTMEDRQFRVASKCELLPFLLSLPLGLSRKQAKDLLRFHAVKVPHKTPVRHDTRLQAGDLVTIALRRQPRDSVLIRNGLKIVHLDDAIVVVEKPSGLLSMGSEREKERTAHRILNEYLKASTKSRQQQAFIVHRLDRETSGLMIFARTETIQATMQQGWKQVTKRYLAVVIGVPNPADGILKDQLAESKSLVVHRVAHGGELAITQYRVIGRYGDKSLLELTLETGRKHQIRVQLALLGHPIVGDRKYGVRADFAQRLALHSCELKFRHPVSDAPMEFRSPLPIRLRGLIGPRSEAPSS